MANSEIEAATAERDALVRLYKANNLTAKEKQDINSGVKTGVQIENDRSAQQQAVQQDTQTKAVDQASRAAVVQDLRNAYNATSDGTRKTQIKATLDAVEGTSGKKDAFERLDEWSINLFQQLSKKHNYISNGINSATSNTAGAIDGLTDKVNQFQTDAIHDIQGWSAGIKKALEPIGACSALGDLTEIAKNPLGAPQVLSNRLTSVANKICPGFVSEMDSTAKTLRLERLSHLPSKMMGSIRCLATAADEILSVPFEIMSDVYNGLMDILGAIADLIDAVVNAIMNIAMAAARALLDAIIPVDELLEFFSAVSDLASTVGDVAGMVGGFGAVADIAGQVGGYASLASGAINNPLGAAIQYIPGASDMVNEGLGVVGQVTSALRNPEQFLPPSIKENMQKISSISGLGFVGNHGYSVGDTLDSLSDGVFQAALKQYTDKSPMLGKYFNKPTERPSVDTQESYPDTFNNQKVGRHKTAAGLPQVFTTSKIL